MEKFFKEVDRILSLVDGILEELKNTPSFLLNDKEEGEKEEDIVIFL